MTLFQAVTLSILGLFAWYQVFRLRKQPLIKIAYKISWIIPTVAGFLVIAFPQVSVMLSNIFGIARGVDFIIYTSIIWLLYKNYSLNKDLDKVDSKLESFVRETALNETKESNN